MWDQDEQVASLLQELTPASRFSPECEDVQILVRGLQLHHPDLCVTHGQMGGSHPVTFIGSVGHKFEARVYHLHTCSFFSLTRP